ncbi:glycosyltransferase [Streptodolium elevatio]|uniref:4,4'-diaponeurosporenoate glycosyltransferase n=1 Tax=Streptodolium elevatio TaxID=3157996 RepID=A0ABV3DKM0_9ACTN
MSPVRRAGTGRDAGDVTRVVVVVPARDEQDELPGCLDALSVAAARVEPIGVRVDVVVAADSCVDRTAAVARDFGARVVETDVGTAGAARAAGFAAALGQSWITRAPEASSHRDRLWLATTDADSRVPRGWLACQIAWAARGWDAVAGTVRVSDWSGHPPGAAEAFAARYHHWHGRPPHVHGANLGFRSAAYQAVGGFTTSAVGEDHDLVRALENAGYRVLRTAAHSVVTSARLDPRAPGGFGHALRAYSEAQAHADADAHADALREFR